MSARRAAGALGLQEHHVRDQFGAGHGVDELLDRLMAGDVPLGRQGVRHGLNARVGCFQVQAARDLAWRA